MSRTDKRGKQGKRLGKWVHVSHAAFRRWSPGRVKQITKACGVSTGLIYNWRAGRRIPSEVAQLKLRDLMGDKAVLPEPPAPVSSPTPKAKTTSRRPEIRVRFTGPASAEPRLAAGLLDLARGLGADLVFATGGDA